MNPIASSSRTPGAPSSERPPPEIPDHEMLRKIGGGSYGEVWLARNIMGAWRAVKVVYRSTFEDERPFEREFNGLKKFEPVSHSHPSQVPILHVGRAADRSYYVMELADDAGTDAPLAHTPSPDDAPGPTPAAAYRPKTLRSLLAQRGALPAAECLKVGLDLATALGHLHEHGLVHRDIKPANIIFVNGRPKLADIGLVTEIGGGGTFVGTEGFVPKEGPGTPLADIYALGMVLYEMLTGFRWDQFPKVPADWAGAAAGDGRRELNLVVMRACEADAKRRCPSAEKLREEFLLLLSGKSLRRLRALERRLAWTWKFAAGLVALAVALALGREYRHRAWQAGRNSELALRYAQLARAGERLHGWSGVVISNAQVAAKRGLDPEVRAEAAAGLAGLDAVLVTNFVGVPAISVAFGPDGSLLSSGDGSSDAVTGRAWAQLVSAEGIRRELAISSDGVVCWSGAGVPLHLTAGTIRRGEEACVLRVATNKQDVLKVFPLKPGEQPTSVLAATPDGSRIAAAVVGSNGARVAVWEISGESIGAISLAATALAFSADGSLLAAGDSHGASRVYSLPKVKEVAVLKRGSRGSPILSLAFGVDRFVPVESADPRPRWLLASGDKSGGIAIWDVAAQERRSECRGSSFNVQSLAFHPDGVTLASAGRVEARLWDVASGRLLLRLAGAGGDGSRALAFSSDGRRLAWGAKQGFDRGGLTIWELQPQRGLSVLRGLSADVRNVWLSKDGRRIAALADNWQLGVWDVAAGRLLWVFDTPQGVLADNAAAAFSADATQLAFASGESARLYDLATGRTVRSWPLLLGLADQMHFDSQGRLLLWRREGPHGQRSARSTVWWRLYDLLATNLSAADGPLASRRQRLEKALGATLPALLHEQSDTNWLTFYGYLPPTADLFVVGNGGQPGIPRRFKAFDVASGRLLWELPTQRDGNASILWDESGRWFSYTLDPTNCALIELPSGKSHGIRKEGASVFDSSRTQFASVPAQGCLLFDQRGEAHGLFLGIDWRASARPCFSADGRLLAWGAYGGAVLVADLERVRREFRQLGLK